MPLGLRWPEQRLTEVLARVALDALVVDERGLGLLTEKLLAATTLLMVPGDDAAKALVRASGGRTTESRLPAAADGFPRTRVDGGR